MVGRVEQELLGTFIPFLSQVILNGAKVAVTLPMGKMTVVSLLSDEAIRPHSISQAAPPDTIPTNDSSTRELCYQQAL